MKSDVAWPTRPGYVNQQTGEDLDPRNREGRFPKGGGKQKKQKTEASRLPFGIEYLKCAVMEIPVSSSDL